MLIVDAQVPIWISGTPVNIRRHLPAYTKDDLLRDMDVAGVRAVHMGRALCDWIGWRLAG